MKDWQSLYKTRGVCQAQPSARLLETITWLARQGCRCVLDLGCGTGRHTVALADAGCAVYGCDRSPDALRIVAEVIPNGHFACCDMTTLPYSNARFDALICHHVVQHGTIAQIEQAVAEMTRVIRPGGFVALDVISTAHPKYRTGREIEPRTRIDTDDIDGHMPHHFFVEEELRSLFAAFTIVRLDHHTGPSELDPVNTMAAWELVARKQ